MNISFPTYLFMNEYKKGTGFPVPFGSLQINYPSKDNTF